jgi:hypothetical protein
MKKIKFSFFFVIPLLVSSCASSTALSSVAISQSTTVSLSQLKEGMDEEKVLQILKEPYSEETYSLGEDQYDVKFYITQPTVLGQTRMTHANLTPIIFLNGRLKSTEWRHYKYLRDESKSILLRPISQEPEHSIDEVLSNKSVAPSDINSSQTPSIPNVLNSVTKPQESLNSPPQNDDVTSKTELIDSRDEAIENDLPSNEEIIDIDQRNEIQNDKPQDTLVTPVKPLTSDSAEEGKAINSPEKINPHNCPGVLEAMVEILEEAQEVLEQSDLWDESKLDF